MSVHVFLTGVRGTIGPFIGYWAAGLIGTVSVGFLSSAMMIVASIMLIPEIKHGKKIAR
jgi:zinc transporter ZupT